MTFLDIVNFMFVKRFSMMRYLFFLLFILLVFTDGQTDRQADKAAYRDARTHLKTAVFTAHLEFSMGRNEVGLG